MILKPEIKRNIKATIKIITKIIKINIGRSNKMNILYLILLVIATVSAFYWAFKYLNWGINYPVTNRMSYHKDFGRMLVWLLLITFSVGCLLVVIIFIKSTFLGG